jgi:hypothetical protein
MKYIEATTDADLAQTLGAIDAAYLADMRAQLGRAPGQTIDSKLNARGEIIGPADSIITTAWVKPIVSTDSKVVGGLIPVDEKTLAYVPPAKVADVKDETELPAKWQTELATKDAAAAATPKT